MEALIKHNSESCHWYFPDRTPAYEQPKADGSGTTPTTLRHARKLNLLPSVTTILKCVAKPGLERWKVSQAVMAAMTSPQRPDEGLDDFLNRVLNVDREQDEEAVRAAELGKMIHAKIEYFLALEPTTTAIIDYPNVDKYIGPVLTHLETIGRCIHSEHIVVGNGYAGKVDAVFESDREIMVVDFKTTKTMPKEPYFEQAMQCGAYSMALGYTGSKRIKCCNIYISTTDPGKFKVCEHEDWDVAYRAFYNLQNYWQILNNYYPKL